MVRKDCSALVAGGNLQASSVFMLRRVCLELGWGPPLATPELRSGTVGDDGGVTAVPPIAL